MCRPYFELNKSRDPRKILNKGPHFKSDTLISNDSVDMFSSWDTYVYSRMIYNLTKIQKWTNIPKFATEWKLAIPMCTHFIICRIFNNQYRLATNREMKSSEFSPMFDRVTLVAVGCRRGDIWQASSFSAGIRKISVLTLKSYQYVVIELLLI
jgi:hypothetical protein